MKKLRAWIGGEVSVTDVSDSPVLQYPKPCPDAIFLGCFETSYGTGNLSLYELYWDAHGPTIFAQWSEQPSHNYSGIAFGWQDNETHPLVEARKRAQARGLDVRETEFDPAKGGTRPKVMIFG